MSEVTTSKTTKKTKIQTYRGWKVPPPPLERARNLAEGVLKAFEDELTREGTPEEKFERLLGSKGLISHLPKLVQLLAHMAPSEKQEEASLTTADLNLLKEWLAEKPD